MSIEIAKHLIRDVYESDGGSVGGYGHIVFSDGNVEDHFIESCIEDAMSGSFSDDLSEDCRIKSLIALLYFRNLSEEEREICLDI